MCVYQNLRFFYSRGLALYSFLVFFQFLSPIENVLARGPVLTRSYFSSPIRNVMKRGVGF